MAGTRLVRRTFIPYEAVQWDGGNVAELEAFLGRHFDYSTSYPDGKVCEAQILGGRFHCWHDIHPGDWVLKGPDGSLSKVDKDEFESGFEDIYLASGGAVDVSRLHRVGEGG